ncbi:MAG TPA: c-type cytochrome [Candidatus Saccharimonadales bacterium]|nr:c-type cytochrome [Candidatus Saccharimonadales bacterium]
MRRVIPVVVVWFGLVSLPGAALSADAAKAPDGKPVFVKYKCGSCHTIETQKIVKKPAATAEPGPEAPDLSGVGVERKAEWIVAFLQKKEKIGESMHEKKFRGTDAELKKLAGWLATLNDEAAAKKMKDVEAKNAKTK